MPIALRIAGYLRKYPGFAVGTLAAALLSTLLGLVYPRLTGYLIDEVIAKGLGDQLPWLIALLALVFLGRDGLNALRILLNNFFEQRVILDLRRDLYAAFQRLPVSWYDHRSSGDLLTRVSEDVMNMERMLIDGIEQGLVALIQIVGVGIILFRLDPHLAAWSLAPIPFLAAGALWYTTTAHPRYRIQRKASSALNSLLMDHLQGIRQIKTYGWLREGAERFEHAAEAVRAASLKIMRAWALYNPAMALVAAGGSCLVLWFGGRAVLEGRMAIGELVAFLLYVGMFYEPVTRLHSLNQLIQAGRAAGERVFAILDAEAEPGHSPALPRKPLPPRQGSAREVRFQNIQFSYRSGREVLHGINLTVPRGSSLALVGPTGAGKTTLASLVARFHDPSSGDVLLDGISLRDISLEEVRREVGVVTQEPFLFQASVRENLELGHPGATDAEIESTLKAACAWDFVQALPDGWNSKVGERGVRLSAGERQRLSIARALLKDPPVLILDEATASVDTATEKEIQLALEHLLAGRTSLIIAHRLSTVRKADAIAVVDQGRIAELGNHEALLRSGGLYAKLWSIQSEHGEIQTIEGLLSVN
ncbi:MAG: ABC transporter ATP-binding protein [Verrucomicrobia bacterium]|nr:ABC transporter ATP-binding protein [Verrucomicrobiota bacterium]